MGLSPLDIGKANAVRNHSWQGRLAYPVGPGCPVPRGPRGIKRGAVKRLARIVTVGALLHVGPVEADANTNDTNKVASAGAMDWVGATPWLDPVPTNLVVVTLDQAMQAAFASAPDVEAAEARMRRAYSELGMQRSAYWPYVVLNVGWEQSRTGRGGAAPELYSASIGANWDLFDGFRREFEVLRARHAREAAVLAAREARRMLQRAVTRAYFWALLAQERMAAAQGDFRFNTMMLEFVSKRYTTGAGTRSDVNNFKIRVAEDVDAYLGQRQLFAFHLAVLGALMAVPEPLAVDTHRLQNPHPEPLDSMRAELTRDLAYARQVRPDVLAKAYLARAAGAEVNAERGQRLPRVRLSATESVNREDNSRFSFSEDYETFLGVTLTWDVFKGGRSHHSINIAKAQRDDADAAWREALRDLEREIRQHAQILDHARMRVGNGNMGYAAAIADRIMVTRLYESGLVAVTRLNEVQKDVAHSLGRLVDARVLFSQTWEEYRIATGYMHATALVGEPDGDGPASNVYIDPGATRPIPIHMAPANRSAEGGE